MGLYQWVNTGKHMKTVCCSAVEISKHNYFSLSILAWNITVSQKERKNIKPFRQTLQKKKRCKSEETRPQ